ncbi:MAG: hypothetical protein R3C61_02095 [Bacteroidia bacterium]
MQLSHEDIARLYGQYLFIIPEELAANEENITINKEEHTPEPVTPLPVPDFSVLKRGAKVEWKLKPDSQLVLVLSVADFSDKKLTGFLKTCIDAAGVQTAHVGFGIFDPAAESWDLSDIPVKRGWFFGADLPFDQAEVGENKLFFHPPLSKLYQDEALKAKLISQLAGK